MAIGFVNGNLVTLIYEVRLEMMAMNFFGFSLCGNQPRLNELTSTGIMLKPTLFTTAVTTTA
jgi:hypothetical protein